MKEAYKHHFILKNRSIESLTYQHILRHSPEIVNRAAIQTVLPLILERNFGRFSNSKDSLGFPDVLVEQSGQDLLLNCSCNASISCMCEHETIVLYALLEKPNLRIFFDKKLREDRIKIEAKKFGFENEPNLEQYFQLVFENNGLEIKPIATELIALDTIKIDRLKTELLPKNAFRTLESEEFEHPISMVISKNKFSDGFSLDLIQHGISLEGKIKNPIQVLDPLDLGLQTNQLAELKYYAAISRFQKSYNDNRSLEALIALKTIEANPLGLGVYLQKSENLTSAELQKISLKLLPVQISLEVNFKEPFYELSGTILIEGIHYDFGVLQLKYSIFIYLKNTFYIIEGPEYLKLLQYFITGNPKVLIHPSQYEVFKKEFLEGLESKISINYTYLHKASETFAEEWKIENKIEKILYLSDQKNFISITLVVKYGQIEVPVFSRKQVYDLDPNGNLVSIHRDEELENAYISLVARLHAEFPEQIQEFDYFYLHKQKFLDDNWFLGFFEELKHHNIKILGFNEIKNIKVNPNKASVGISLVSGLDWFSTAIKLQFGKQEASIKELHKSLRNKSKFVELGDGTLGVLPQEWLQRFSAYFRQGDLVGEILNISKTNFLEILELYDEEVVSKEAWRELNYFKDKLLGFSGIKELAKPVDLQAELRTYQMHGLNWLNFLDDYNFGACLADDMGLGKTVQVLAFLLHQRSKVSQNTNLIIVPTSLIHNWQNEIEKFAPSLKVYVNYDGKKISQKQELDKYEIVLTTYGMLLNDIRFLKDYTFNYVILDESQNIKNPNSQRHKTVRLLSARNRIALTGTPIENNVFDLYGQMSFLNPGLLGNKQYFRDMYVMPIDKFYDEKRGEELQRKISPFVLRRTKKQVAKELPLKTEMLIYCEMGKEQRKVYDRFEKELRDYINFKKPEDILKNSMHVLTGITKLRQICNSPALLPDEEFKGEQSSKLDVLIEQIETKSKNHKILVFSQFVSMLDLIKKRLDTNSIKYEYLTGQTKKREEKVNNFQNNPEIRVFLISLKAGGTGLNLTEADYVYLVDPWWNPAVENQAIDRSYRIGQTQNVVAVRLICPDTIEEKMMDLQAAKVHLSEELIKTDKGILKNLSKEELLALLR